MFNFDFWDKLNFDFWDKEWTAIRGAPHILFWTVVIVILAILLIVVIVRWGYSREIAGLKAEKAAFRERLTLACDGHALVTQQVEILTKQVEQLSQQISQKKHCPPLSLHKRHLKCTPFGPDTGFSRRA
jgi:type II secretory pathway pseudopilin PulG